MTTGSELVETWIPDGGFKVEGRKVRTPDGDTLTDCLIPRWEIGELTSLHPCARQPALHRIVADCPPEKDAVLDLAGHYGLMTSSIALRPEPGKPVPLFRPNPSTPGSGRFGSCAPWPIFRTA
jgi:hypothetical protein